MSIDTNKIVISKANSLRFAHRNGLLRSMDNQLSCEETWEDKPRIYFEDIRFLNDVVLIQVFAGLTATVVLTQYFEDDSTTVHPVDDTTTYSTHKIYDYVITLSALGVSRFGAASEEDPGISWLSEWIDVIDVDNERYRLIQWTNLDLDTSNSGFDYNTTLAIANVNFLRLMIDDSGYVPGGETEVYDNQNEASITKATAHTNIVFKTDFIPRQIARLLVMAMKHDRFLVNQVQYIVPDLPDVGPQGGWVELSVEMRVNLAEGENTHNIGFDCDAATSGKMTEIKEVEGAVGDGQFAVSAKYAVNYMSAAKVSGTPLLKLGSTVGGEEILPEMEITKGIPPHNFNRDYNPDFDGGSWIIYYTLSGGVIDLAIQTQPFRQ